MHPLHISAPYIVLDFGKIGEKMEMLGPGTAAKSVVAPPGVGEENT